MQYDLKMIKKYYGEDMMHFCRDNFSTLLEKEGQLFKLIESKFAHNKVLYDDIKEAEIERDFVDYVNSLTNKKPKLTETDKSVVELLNDVGYDFFECRCEEDIQKFAKYYEPNEALCTFRGDRLNSCYVFFAVKKNVDNIKRENFSKPSRQDEYGTSVISIQFSKGEINTLSIKNRYNHTVKNPDATFSNNLEYIVPGLTKAFEHDFNLNIDQNTNAFKIEDDYVLLNGKYYRFNYEGLNTYYCIDNVIIDNFNIQEEFLDKTRYLVFEHLILDMREKKLYPYEEECHSFIEESIGNITSLSVTNIGNNNKKIHIINGKNEEFIIVTNKCNRIVKYINNNIVKITNIKNEFAFNVTWNFDELEYFEAKKLQQVGNDFFSTNYKLKELIVPNLKEIGTDFLWLNRVLEKFECDSLEKVGNNFMEAYLKFSDNDEMKSKLQIIMKNSK